MIERDPTMDRILGRAGKATGIHQVLSALAPSSPVPPWLQAAAVIAFTTAISLPAIVAIELKDMTFRRGSAVLGAPGQDRAVIPGAFAGPVAAIARTDPPTAADLGEGRTYLFPSSAAARGHLSVSALTHRFRANEIVLLGHRNLQVRAALQAAAESVPLASLGADLTTASPEQIWHRYPR